MWNKMATAVNGFEAYRKVTRKVDFAKRMDKLIPCPEFCAIGDESSTALAHSATVTPANVHDNQELPTRCITMSPVWMATVNAPTSWKPSRRHQLRRRGYHMHACGDTPM